VQERYLPENLPFHYSPIAIRYSPLAAVLMRRKFSAALEGASPDAPKIFGSAGALPSRKPLAIRYSLFTIRHSPIANHQSLPFPDLPISRFADKFGSAGASPSQLVHRLKSVSTKNEAC
jgi:hypothetical protein